MILTVFNVIAPVALVVLLGFFAVKAKLFPAEGVPFLTKFVHSFAVPFLIFDAVRKVDFANNFDPKILLSYFLPAFFIFILGIICARNLGKTTQASVVLGFCALFANSVYIGLPISERAFGEQSLTTNYVILAVHSSFCYIIGAISMEIARGDSPKWSQTFQNIGRDLITNPLMIGAFFGFMVNMFSFAIPSILEDSISMLARAALPVGLFSLGGVLTRLKIKGEILPMVMMSALKLILFPLLVWICGLWVFHMPSHILKTLVLLAALPTGTNGFIFAGLYKTEEETAASIVFLSTLLSVVFLPAWLILLSFL